MRYINFTLCLGIVITFLIPSSTFAQTYDAPQPVYQTQPQPIYVQSAPQVIPIAATPSGKVKELPRTGPSVWVYILIGLLPLGLILRKYGTVKENPKMIWRNRQSHLNE